VSESHPKTIAHGIHQSLLLLRVWHAIIGVAIDTIKSMVNAEK
jgi:hypothetical protein